MAFVDEVIVKLKAGDGGDGCLSFHRAKFVPKGGPDGGDGGKGGDLYLLCDENTQDLTEYSFEPEQEAKSGGNGMGLRRKGRDGKDRVLRVPMGTDVYDVVSGKLVAALLQNGQKVKLLKGGKGGRGNYHFKSSVNRTPRQFTPGKPGLRGTFRLELRSIADVGLVGFPNAGKSSLINALTRAKSKVGAYPFTTMNPNLGYVNGSTHKDGVIMADIPGLIEGAHENRGLGHRFLKHIERCKALLFVVDVSEFEGRDPKADFKVLVDEIKHYEPTMLDRRMLVAANKIDLIEDPKKRVVPASTFKVAKKTIPSYPVSALTGDGLDDLRDALDEIIR